MYLENASLFHALDFAKNDFSKRERLLKALLAPCLLILIYPFDGVS